MFNPKSAIFIFNKWDEVRGEETRKKLLENNIKKLKILWPGIDAEKQIYCLSVTTVSFNCTSVMSCRGLVVDIAAHHAAEHGLKARILS
jgi:hypothetical protein